MTFNEYCYIITIVMTIDKIREELMKTVSKGTLKAKMLAYFREIEITGNALIVTDNHRPVLKIIPYQKKQTIDEVFAKARGKFSYSSPLEESTESEWGDLA